MTVGICGLGLIGGSMAKAYKEAAHTVFAFDIDETTLQYAKLADMIDGILNEETIPLCDLILVALYPKQAALYLECIAPTIDPKTLVVDLCGTKKNLCACGFALSKQYGFTFVGGHPMAGTQFSGIKYAKASLFRGAPMVLVPPTFDDIALLDRVKALLSPAGFGRFSVTTAEAHDTMIAFTSQMPHILSNAFIKSPTALEHKGFSAGSYKDLTRVAWLNPQMWAELCMENRENMLFEINTYITNLQAYQKALVDGDIAALTALLEEGKKCKEEVDG